MQKLRRSFLALVFCALIAASGVVRADDEWKPRKIVGTEDMMPDGGTAQYLTGWPVINDNGDVAFIAMTKKEKPKLEFATLVVVRDAQAKLRVAMQKGMNLGGNEAIDGVASIVLTDDGFVGARVSTTAPRPAVGGLAAMFAEGGAIVRSSPDGKFSVIAKTGNAAAGVDGGTYLVLSDTPGLTKDGRMIFSGGLKENGKATGGALWCVAPDGSVKLIARKGMAIAGLKADDLYGTIMTTTSGILAEDGTSVFNSFLAAKEQHTDISRFGAWRVNGKGETTPLMYSWLESPFAEDQFGKKGTPSQWKGASVNARGEIALAITQTRGVRAGLLTVNAEGTVRVAATSETPQEGFKINSMENVLINNKGRVAFVAWVYSDAEKGSNAIIAEDNAGKLKIIARGGTEAPDSGGRKFQFLDAPQFCATGQVAFSASLDDKSQGVWMTDTTGKLRLIAMSGQKMPFSSGVTRTISHVSIGIAQSGGGDGRPRSLSNNGTLIYFCQFVDENPKMTPLAKDSKVMIQNSAPPAAILVGNFVPAK